MDESLTHSLTHSLVVNNERKKERKAYIKLNLYLNGNDEKDAGLLEGIETLRHRDRWSMTQFLREASLEYVGRHLPGNPGLPLTHWTGGEPLSIAALEKLSRSKVPLAGALYNLKCRFCGGWFWTSVDMSTPTCLKCTKPEATT